MLNKVEKSFSIGCSLLVSRPRALFTIKFIFLFLVAGFLWNLLVLLLDISQRFTHPTTLSLSISSKENGSSSSSQQHSVFVEENLPIASLCPNNTATIRPWLKSHNLPPYLKEYLDWHVEVRCALDGQLQQQKQKQKQPPDDTDVKYLVVQCLREYNACGGLADRLLPLPIYVLYAYKMKRLLLVRWTRPFPLEEFLIPFGINWTVPEWLVTNIPDYLNTKSAMRFNNLATKLNSTKVMTAGLQIGAKQLLEFYNTQIRVDFNDTEYTYQRVYRDLFHSIFALVNPIQELVQNTLLQLNLTPGAYTSVHVRARHHESGLLYGNHTIDKSGGLPFSGETKVKLLTIMEHALSCAVTLRPGSPIYIATDSHHATHHVILQNEAINNVSSYSSYRNDAPARVVGSTHSRDPLHLDEQHTPQHYSRTPSDYYHIFADLWLLGMSQCSAVGVGGFGRLGMNLSYNSSCFIDYTEQTTC